MLPLSPVVAGCLRRFGPASCTIFAFDTIRFKMDSAITASCNDLYQSSGSNWLVTTVVPLPFSRGEDIEDLRRGLTANRGREEVVQN